jgi:histidinol-phosphate/aromatic aminotransferase/cobyric acid decarboxylase-like protein/choline kinase
MQAVILAAGGGKRLGHLTRNSTKCMVALNGRRLIEYAFDAIAAAGLSPVIMVVGHGADEVRAFLGDRFQGVEVRYIVNPIYAKSNNIYSLLLAKEAMEAEDTMLLESDLIFDKELLLDCLKHESPNLAVVAKFRSWMDGTVATVTPESDISGFISKKDMNWDELHLYFKTVNIYKLSREFSRKQLFPFLKAYIEAHGLQEYYEEVFKILTFVNNGALQAFEIGNRHWYEIDDIQDLDIASVIFADEKDRLAMLKKRYGGFWRFPFLLDYCYLVNPYFPSPRLIAEFTMNFPTLLAEYPSGQSIQNLLAAKMSSGRQEYFLAGNGASELIKGLLKELDGPVGIHLPTFDEYTACARPGSVVEFRSPEGTFDYSAAGIHDFVVAHGIKTYILINPDNPTGHLLSRPDILDLLDRFQTTGTRLILDESFADFIDGTEGHSFLDHPTLDGYKNLIVMKSISKSYGVPGLRLGIMASSDTGLLAKTRANLSIWNINSFAESFMQIIDKYKNDFRAACRRIGEERERLFAGLAAIRFLEPLPSKANYILCRVGGAWTSSRLAEELLRRKWIFIKDLAGKKGFEKGSFVRLTVRDQADDDVLLDGLRELEREG